MSISAKELVALATAGFNSVQIAQIAAAYDNAPAAPAAPAVPTAPAAPAAPAASAAPAVPAAPATSADPMDKVIAQLQQLTNAMQNGNALMSNQPVQQTPEDIIAEIIRPPKPVNK